MVILSCGSSSEFDDLQLSDFEKNVRKIIQPHIDSVEIAGSAVAVVKGDSTYLIEGYGLADLENGEYNELRMDGISSHYV